MLKRAIATRYATALFLLAEEKGILEDIERDFPGVADVYSSSEELTRFLTHPAIGPGEKKEVLEKLFEGKIHETLYDLVMMTVDKNREEYIPLIWEDFRRLLMEHRGQMRATIFSPFELSTELKQEVEIGLEKVTGKTILLEEKVDNSLIGGIRILIGDRVYDGSVVSTLEQLRETLMTAPV